MRPAPPLESRCSSSPSIIYVTVSNPRCGWSGALFASQGEYSTAPMWSKRMKGSNKSQVNPCEGSADLAVFTFKDPRSVHHGHNSPLIRCFGVYWRQYEEALRDHRPGLLTPPPWRTLHLLLGPASDHPSSMGLKLANAVDHKIVPQGPAQVEANKPSIPQLGWAVSISLVR